jgi:dTDP-4-amino-4,6-dideoxygalactose transaminase
MEPLLKIVDQTGHGLFEDAAQCQGARQNGRPVGSHSGGAATSFYPGKNLGAWGDAGAVVTNLRGTATRVRALRTYGSTVRYEHPEFGVNSRLDALQAVVLSEKLKHLDEWNALRRRAADFYLDALDSIDRVTPPIVADGNEHVWHLFVIRVDDRDRVLKHLNENGIDAGIHYPTPIHLHGAMESLGHKAGAFPVAERAADTMISLPMYPGITESQQSRVLDALGAALH